jgi:hypothetical protein
MSNVKYIFFLSDNIYNISHILSKFIDKFIYLIYIVDNNISHKILYQQEKTLKYIYRLNFNTSILYINYTKLSNTLSTIRNCIYLNAPNLLNINLEPYLHNYKIIDYNNFNNLHLTDMPIILTSFDHGFDEENIMYSYINNVTNNFSPDVTNNTLYELKLKIVNHFLNYKINNIISFEKKSYIFKNIYNIDSNKKTIIFSDNYLTPFLTSKDIDSYEEYICNKIINILIELKNNFNVIVRLHPFNEDGIKLNKEYPDILFEHFIIDFTPFELSVLYNNCDIVISNRYTSSGFESLFYNCKTIFIDYNFDKRIFSNYLTNYTNKIFEYLLTKNYIINNSIIPVIQEDNFDLIKDIVITDIKKNINMYMNL